MCCRLDSAAQPATRTSNPLQNRICHGCNRFRIRPPPAAAAYYRGEPFGVAVLTITQTGITRIVVFDAPGLVLLFPINEVAAVRSAYRTAAAMRDKLFGEIGGQRVVRAVV